MSKVETWVNRADRDLYDNGKPGVIRQFYEQQAEHRGQRRLFNYFVILVGLPASADGIIKLLEWAHVLAKK